MQPMLPLAVLAPFAAAAAVLLVGRRAPRAHGVLVLIAAVASFIALARIPAGDAVPHFTLPWMPAIDVAFALRGDPFGLFLALLVAGVGAFVALYAIPYMQVEDPVAQRRFFAALAAFMGSMLGIALADDLILLFVFWELTSITSFLLIGFRFADDRAKAGAVLALQVTALGGLAMSVGFLLVGQVTGTFSLSAIAGDRELVARLLASPLAAPALVLVLLGAFTKSAQVPFHFWLPRAMVAPTPVSAYLHAATMVKAGVFLLARMLPLFEGSPLWAPLLTTVGTATMTYGAWRAFRETDLKAILAYTTASTLGLITLLYGLEAPDQDALQILSHALYKGALFLVVGIVEHRVHTRDIRQLGGLARELPWAFAACILGALSMAGIPPLLGFLAKESFYSELLLNPAIGPLLARGVVLTAAVAANALLAAVAARLVVAIFLGPPSAVVASHLGAAARHRDVPPLWISPLALGSGALALGLLGLTTFTDELAAGASSRARARLHLSLVPALGLPLYLTLVTLVLATVVYWKRDRFVALQHQLTFGPSADAHWESMVALVGRIGDAFSARWQNGSLRWYLTLILVAVPALAGYALVTLGLSYRAISGSLADMPWYGFLLCVLLAVATLTAVRATTRLQAAIATTTIGFVVSMLFVVYRSPDILLTQILIETVSTIFVLLVLIFLPPFPRHDLSRSGRMVNAAIAAVFSFAITVLMLLSMTPGLREPDNISTRPGGLLSLSLAEGGGANAVNVIIVDIRAMDTNGEITVLVVVGLCIYGLLRTRREAT